MKFIKLSREQIEKIYHERMKKDFPPDELRPLSNLLQCLDRGTYEFLGFVADETEVTEDALVAEEDLVGYMSFTVMGRDYLVDYLAIDSKRRNLGYGTRLMSELALYLSDASSIIGEVEDPKYAKTSEEEKLQERRYQFYLRNGVRDTGVEVTCFGVHYVIMEVEVDGCHSPEKIRQLYRDHYKALLPKELYEANIIV